MLLLSCRVGKYVVGVDVLVRFVFNSLKMFVYDIPFSSRYLLCQILDSDDQMWKNLAGEIGFTALEVGALERQYLRKDGSPADSLLNRWGHSNATVDMLAYKLISIRALRAFDIIKHLVSRDVLASIEKNSPSSAASTDQSSFKKTKSIISDEDLPCPSFQDSEESFEKVAEPSGDSNCCSVDMNDARMKKITFYPFVKVNFATDNFDKCNILGNGKFSTTYKGRINQTRVAIKVLRKMEEKCIPQSFCEDIDLLINHPHENLALLMAISQDGPNLCFVYQYLENGSLRDRFLCKDNSLSLTWNHRHTILRDASRGLLHLHTMDPKPVLHKNIKSSSILLGTNFVAKLGDFGLLCESDGPEAVCKTRVTRVEQLDQLKEQQAYLPDEFFRYGSRYTLLTDIYAFGMVILEVCMGRDAIEWFEKSGKSLAEHVQEQFSSYGNNANQLISSLKDSSTPEWDDKFWATMFMLGKLCTDGQKPKRPATKQVYNVMEKCCNDIFDKISSPEKLDDFDQNMTKQNDTKALQKMQTACIRNQANDEQATDIYSPSSGQCSSYSDFQSDPISPGQFVSISEDISKMMAKKPFLDYFVHATCMGDSQENIYCDGEFLPKSGILCSGSAKSDMENFQDDILYHDKCSLKNGEPCDNSESRSVGENGDRLEISFSSKESISGDISTSGHQQCGSGALSDLDSSIKRLLQDDEKRFAMLENLKKEYPDVF